MQIILDDLSDPRIEEFLNDHIRDMRAVSPPESCHTLNLQELKKPDVSFWSAWQGDALVGCGGLKKLDASHAEIKSMRVTAELRGQGRASQLLTHILDEAKRMGLQRLSLETGSMDFFHPACKLYEKFGFVYCEPFGTYVEDSNSLFMSLELAESKIYS